MKKLLKLVRLLKEYEEWKVEKYWIWNYIWLLDKDLWIIFADRFPDRVYISQDESRAIIISKGYNFIKWLVDNDKIDLLKLDNRIALLDFNKVDRVLMALSIQESPIEYLISILR